MANISPSRRPRKQPSSLLPPPLPPSSSPPSSSPPSSSPVRQRNLVMDGVRLGFGMFVVLPVIILIAAIVFSAALLLISAGAH